MAGADFALRQIYIDIKMGYRIILNLIYNMLFLTQNPK